MAIKTRETVIDGAFDLLSRRPTATLAEIAEHAGVGRATLHRHFRSREALIGALARFAIQELNAAIDEKTKGATSHAEGLRLAFEAMVPLGARHWFLTQEPVERDPEIAALMKRDMEALRAEIEAARAEGLFAPDVPTAWIAQSYSALVYAAWTMVQEGEATPRQAADLAWRTLTGGLGR